MKAARRKRRGATSSEPALAGPLDLGETRAIMIGAVVLTIFLYFIKLILLPFVLAGIVAYICTPLLDWAAKRTGWPRLLFAVALFLLLFGIGILVFALRRPTPGRRGAGRSPRICRACWRTLPARPSATSPFILFGIHTDRARYLPGRARADARLVRSQTDQIGLVTGYGLAVIMGAFLTIVLLFYFLVSGSAVARGLFWIVPPHRRPLVGAHLGTARSGVDALFHRRARRRGLCDGCGLCRSRRHSRHPARRAFWRC